MFHFVKYLTVFLIIEWSSYTTNQQSFYFCLRYLAINRNKLKNLQVGHESRNEKKINDIKYTKKYKNKDVANYNKIELKTLQTLRQRSNNNISKHCQWSLKKNII